MRTGAACWTAVLAVAALTAFSHAIAHETAEEVAREKTQAACVADKAGHALTPADASALYACLAEDLHAGYRAGDKRWIPAEFVDDYRSWTAVSAFPAAPGVHGTRFLMTYVNAIGAETYLRYQEAGVTMPEGTVMAMESFAVNDEGQVQNGPLFLMQKVTAGTSPETGDWYYMAVTPAGAPMTMNVITACSDCHQGSFGARDGVGYPVPEARVTR
ncbi:cytochrome P460 family protein [Stappia sp.]|uniref:cytochrome P460 family protein n=1 Tax=Stappia sp. TaxID=1870903 RepID=UPI0032D8B722